MKKKVILSAAVALFLGIGIFTTVNITHKRQMSDLTLANIEAQSFNPMDWWDSNVYDCMAVAVWEYDCYFFKNIPRNSGDIYVGPPLDPYDVCCGYFQKFSTECTSGNAVAHCWNC